MKLINTCPNNPEIYFWEAVADLIDSPLTLYLYAQPVNQPLIEECTQEDCVAVCLGDENHRAPKLLERANVKLGITNYAPYTDHPKLITVPLPCLPNYNPTYIPILQRQHDISFCGQVTLPSRRLMRVVIDKYAQQYQITYYNTYTDGFRQGLSIKDYTEVMEQTKIALVPFGGGFDTFRYTEAIRAGCVVITLKRPARWYLSPCTIYLDEWYQLPAKLNELLGNPTKMQEISDSNIAHYNDKMSPKGVARYIWTTLSNMSSNYVRSPVLP